MRRFVLLTAIPALAVLVPGLARAATDAATGQVAVAGNVAPLCILGDPSRALVDLGQMVATSGAGAGRIAALPPQSVNLPGSFCNFAGSAVGVTSRALVGPAGSPPASFARTVNYTASASGWATGTASATSNAAADGNNPDASGTGATQNSPRLADIGVTLSAFTVPGNALLVSGNYAGAVTVTLGPVVSGN